MTKNHSDTLLELERELDRARRLRAMWITVGVAWLVVMVATLKVHVPIAVILLSLALDTVGFAVAMRGVVQTQEHLDAVRDMKSDREHAIYQ